MRDLRKIKPLYQVELDDRQITYLFFGSLVALLMVFSLGIILGWQLRALDKETELVAQISGVARSVFQPNTEENIDENETPPLKIRPSLPKDIPQDKASLQKNTEHKKDQFSDDISVQTSMPGKGLTLSQAYAVESSINPTSRSPSMNPETLPLESNELPEIPTPNDHESFEGRSQTLEETKTPVTEIDTEALSQSHQSDLSDPSIPASAAPPISNAQLASMGTLYTVQIASFRGASEALDLTQRLQNKGLSAYVQSVDLSVRGRWYRVRVGTFREMDGAKKFAQAISEHEGMEAIVLRYEQ